MDSHNFSSETNSIFVVQESSTEDNIKHEFKVCDDNSEIHLDDNDELKKGKNKSIASLPTSLNAGKDHDYGNTDKTVEVTVNNENVASRNNKPVFKGNSVDDSGEINVTVTIHDNLVCSIEEGKPTIPKPSDVNSDDVTIIKDKLKLEDSYHNEKNDTSAIIAKSTFGIEDGIVNPNNLVSEGQIMTGSSKKIFKPISITSIKSLKITKPENFSRNRMIVNPIFRDQDLNNRNIRRSEAWKHFSHLSSQEMECNFCQRKFSSQSCSSNLLRHLRSQHGSEIYLEEKLIDEFNAEESCINSSVDLENVKNKTKKISKIWKYFSKSKLGKVKCKICFKIIPYRNSNSLLVRHLRLKHLYIYNCNISRSSKYTKRFRLKSNLADFDISDQKIVVKRNVTDLYHNLYNADEYDVNYPSSSLNNFTYPNSKKRSRKLSESWKHFTKLQSDKIKCNICDKTLKYIEGVSSNLTRHLKVRHFNIYSKNSSPESPYSSMQSVAVSHQNEKFVVNSVKSSEIQINDSNDYDDDKNVTKIRKYFSKFNVGKVKCNLCQVILTHTPGMTFNLKCHIILKHKNIFEKIVKAIYNEENKNIDIGNDIEMEYKKIKLNWKYFTKMKSCKLKCNLCTEMPLFYCSTSESLLHLHSKHNITLDSDEEQSVVSFIELNDKEPYNINTKEAEDSNINDFEANDLQDSLGVLKTDRTWKFFSKIYHDKVIEVKCNLCDDVFSYTHGIISNLTDHLNMVHKDEGFENGIKNLDSVEKLEIENVDVSSVEGSDSVSYPIEKSRTTKHAFSKKRLTWEYFTVTEQFKARCNICFNSLTFSSRSSSNLSRHLKRRHSDIINLKNAESIFDNIEEQNKIEFQYNSFEEVDDKSSLEVKSIYEFLKEDLKLKHCIKFESEAIKCNFCSNSFLCQDVNSYLCVLQQHMQINHAEWQVVCVEDINKYEKSSPKQTDVLSIYNELEAIEKEVQSYSISNEKVIRDDNENESAEISKDDVNNSQNDIYKNVWKYFTKLTSQNVRCNFCCTLLLFRNNKKWNLYRHLRLKHKAKLDQDDAFFYEGKPEIKNLEFHDKSPQKKSPDRKVKKDSPQKKNMNSDKSRSLVKIHTPSDVSEEEDRSKNNVKPIFTPRTGRTWSHFTKVEMGKATCNVCHKSIHYTGTGLDVLNEHLGKCYGDTSSTKYKLKFEDTSLKLSVNFDQRSKLKNNITFRRSRRISGGDKSSNKDDKKSLLKRKISSSSESIISGKSDDCVDSNDAEDKNDHDSDVDSDKRERTSVIKEDDKENEQVSKSNSVYENTFVKKRNELWPYFTNEKDGSAKCHLCLLRIPYKDKAVNLIRHLRRIHSVISVPNPTKEHIMASSEDKQEKSQLLAAINLAPNKLVESEKQVCFTKLGKKTAKCNFCSKIILHKSGNIRKLSNHLLQMHCREIFSYNELMLKHVKIFEKSDDISISPIDLRSANLNQLKSEKDSCDQNDMPNKKRSVTWLYYKKLSSDSAQCNICNKALSYKGGSVYNLTRHLFIKHNIKLSRYAALQKQRASFLSDKSGPKIFNFCKKKSSTLSFYTKINRFFVKCKLCYKHFIYKGVHINRLVNHLWSSHIARLIDFNYGPTCSNSHLSESNAQMETNNSHSPMENYIKNTAEVIYQSMSHNIIKNETKRKISNTWKYYTKKSKEGFKAKCNICYKYFSFKNGNVSNLSRHLLRNHGIQVIKNYQNDKEEEKEMFSDQGSDNLNPQGTYLRESFFKNTERDGREKHHFRIPFTGLLNKEIDKSEKNLEKKYDPDVWKYMKINNDEIECNICEKKIGLKNDKLSESNLRGHLFLKHRIKPSHISVINKPFGKKVKNKVLLGNCFMNIKNKKLKNSFARHKCKLCNRYFILKENKTQTLFKHLSSHEKELSEDANVILKAFQNSNDSSKNCDEESKDDSHCRVNVESTLNEMTLLKYFKNINLLKNKCKICHKFISSKICCTHHVANDLSITYGVKRNRLLGDEALASNTGTGDTIKLHRQKRLKNLSNKNNYRNHFLNVNSCENKCGSCNLYLENKGYCSHSLNQWLNEKQLEESKNVLASDNNIKMKDELEIITDALSGGENKIIIITDDGAPSILNYEDSDRNRTESDDVSYHVIDMDGENNDDIQVVIYNFDPEEGEKSIELQADGTKIEESKYPAGSTETCDKELAEQVKVILQELNNANVFSNQSPHKCKSVVTSEEKPPAAEKISISQQSEVLPEKEKEVLISEEKPLKQIFNELDNKKKVEVQPIPSSGILSEDFVNKEFNDHPTKICVASLELPESLESSQKIKDLSEKSIVEDKLSSSIQKELVESICEPPLIETDNYLSNSLIKIEQPKETVFEAAMVPDENSSQSENTSDKKKFDEATVNFKESEAEFNSNDTIIYGNDSLEINSGMFLQNLNSLHKINKNLIYFSNIDYTYNTAKCNICNNTLLFNSPMMYNLLAHLYSIHKNRIATTNGLLDVTCDKNGKKILDLLNYNNANNVYAVKSSVKPRRKSPVWKYFINNMNFRATCKICRFNFSYKGGAVNNLGRHLRLRHNVHISTRNVDGDDSNYDDYDEPDINEFKGFPMLPKKRAYVKLRSKTWNYFSKEPNDWAKCILCKRYLSYRSSTINNLTRHLRTVHADIYSCLFIDKEILVDDGTGKSEVMNDEIFKNILLETTASRSRDEVLQECSYSASEQIGTKRTSVVWNYFNEVNRDSGRCNFCSKLISCKGGGTSNLSRHLRVKHGIWIVLTSTLAKKYEEQFTNDIENNETSSLLNQHSDPLLTPQDKIITHEELHYLKNKKPESKKSKTWDYFVKDSPDKVVCKICSKVLSYKCKAVHNLRRHLAIKHPDCMRHREPVRLKLQIDNNNESVTYEGQTEPSVIDRKYIDITNTSVVIVDEETPPPMRKAERSSRPKKSLVWNYFEELEYGIAKCNLCSKVLSFRGGGTNNLMRHLRSQHAIIIDLQVAEDSGFTLNADDNDPNANASVVVSTSDDSNFVLGD